MLKQFLLLFQWSSGLNVLKIEGGNGEPEKKEGIKYISPEVQEK